MSGRRVITAQSELGVLREGSVIKDRVGAVMERVPGGWYYGDKERAVVLPAIVLWEPNA